LIAEWLGDTSLEEFRAQYFQRRPYVAPSTAASAIPLLDWAAVGRLVESGADVMVVRNGRLLSDDWPRHREAARALFAEGFSLVIRGCDEHDPPLRALAASVSREFEGEVAIQAFVTPAGCRSFGWHYDCEDVFIAQTCGKKDYELRANTVNPAPTLDAMPRDMHFERETSPVIATTLFAGDWLYLPRGFWHQARGLEDSLSLSIGVLGGAARGGVPLEGRAWDRRHR
jgi:50S ribosomal protein L16 3-hydroxylase